MLVLISFGLVLVAIVLLVLGLLAGTGLTLIYASIASSLTAGIVLVVAKVTSGPTEEEPARPAAAPAREPQPVGAGTTASFPTPSPAETTAPVPIAAQEPAYAPTPRQPAMAGAAVGSGAAATLGGAGEEDAEDFFPIEDYDELKVSEIVPLLPELYEDELDMVEERERAGKGRVSILNRIGELRDQPLEEEPLEDELEPQVDTAAVATADVPGEEDADDFFPIEDYDELNVGEIVPLLPELYDDELDVVEARERATKNRAAILNRIADLRDQPLEDELEPEVDTAAVAAADVPGEEDLDDFFPIEDYDELSVGEILPLLPELYDDELDVVEARERATKNRAAILNRIADLRDQPLEDELEPDVDTAAVAAADVPDEEDLDDFFPIEDYDELNVGEIVPLLPELYDDELDVVEDRERATKNRAAILNRIAELRDQPLGEPEPVALTGEGEDEDFFPIEDYDELSVGEILPLLPELYDDEFEVVEDRERATKNRAPVLDRLAELREETEPQVAASAFPIGNYDGLSGSQIRALLPQLSEDELDQVRRREQDGKNRSTVLAAIDRELGVAPPAPARKGTAKKGAAKKGAAKKGAAKKGAAKKAAAKKTSAKKAPAKKAPAKKASAKKTTGTKATAAVKKTAAPTKKAAARGTTAKKATAKKATGKKATAKKAARRR